jgi:hypothetical protein
MKTLMMLTLAVAITTSGVARDRYFSDAQRHRSVDLAPVAQRYIECLSSENEGVVNSALAHATWMKLMVPERSFTDLQARINALAAMGSTSEIRYRAYLASMVYDRPALFKGEEAKEFQDGDDMFTSVSQRLSFVMLEKGNAKYVREH